MSKRKAEDLDVRMKKRQMGLFQEYLDYMDKKRSKEQHPGSEEEYDTDPGNFDDKDFLSDDEDEIADGSKGTHSFQRGVFFVWSITRPWL